MTSKCRYVLFSAIVLVFACKGDELSLTDVGAMDAGVGIDGLSDQQNVSDGPSSTAPKIKEIIPSDGLAGKETPVTLVGENFDKGIVVYVDGGQEIVMTVKVTSSVSAFFVMPKNPYGAPSYDQPAKVTVQVRQGNEGSNLVDFQYTVTKKMTETHKGQIDTTSLDVFRDFESDPVFSRIYVQGVTDTTSGAPQNLIAQLGIGTQGINPAIEPGFTTWIPAAFKEDAGEYDRFFASLKATQSQTYDIVLRFSQDGGRTWAYADTDESDLEYNPNDAGKLNVEDPPQHYCQKTEHCFLERYRIICKVDTVDPRKNKCVECETSADCAAHEKALGPTCANNMCACGTQEECAKNPNGPSCTPDGYCGCLVPEDCLSPTECGIEGANGVQVCI
ncbi:MAG: IPT/TIG domain-containing protein [Pseudomonadota bacterium]